MVSDMSMGSLIFSKKYDLELIITLLKINSTRSKEYKLSTKFQNLFNKLQNLSKEKTRNTTNYTSQKAQEEKYDLELYYEPN